MRSISPVAFLFLLLVSSLLVSLSWIAHLPRARFGLEVGFGLPQSEALGPFRARSPQGPPVAAFPGSGTALGGHLKLEVLPFAYLSEAGRWISSFDLDPPAYPETARREGREGLAVVVVEVDESGRVRGLWLGRGSGHRDLDEAALRSARSLRVELRGEALGTPRAFRLIVPFEFRLKR